MNALPLMIGALCVLAIGYRYYSAFLAAKVAVLDDSRETPAHTLNDGQNFMPMNKWVLFGHHFAAITGAGPLIGPVLAAQFGYLPGLLWLVVGVVLAGAVHDFIIMAASVRRGGKSLAEIARSEISPLAGIVAALAILFILIIALAGLGMVVVNALRESAWGMFTVAASVPIALFVGWYMTSFRPGKIVEASVIGMSALLACVYLGGELRETALASFFSYDAHTLTILLAGYGFIASVLPVWLLMCPRDYLSSYLKLGTIALLVTGIIVVNPELKMPALTDFIHGGGPIVPGKIFPFVFITIACGAISGFHALVGSGTTPKMISKESHIRTIGYGAMLCEGLVGVVALIATCALYEGDYFAINLTPEQCASYGCVEVELPALSAAVGTDLHGRTGGAVSLAVGMAQIFSGIPGLGHLMKYWYHFAIMFEALFILTTIDTGTRIARYVLQEFVGKRWKKFGRTDWLPANLLASGAVVVAWGYFIWTGTVRTIWPMFGIANQLLAAAALAVGTTIIIKEGRARYAWVTLAPMAFVTVTTLYAGWLLIVDNFLPLAQTAPFRGYLNVALTVAMMAMILTIIEEAARVWWRELRKSKKTLAG
jgi:carbon starvation protein